MNSQQEGGAVRCETTFYFADPEVADPAYFLCAAPEHASLRDPGRLPHKSWVEDIRGREEPLSLDRNGLAFVTHPAPLLDFYDAEQVRSVYYPQAAALVKEATGADWVHIFDHNLRSKARVPEDHVTRREAIQNPVKSVHNDYTETSAPQRIRDLFPERAECLLRGRYAMINVWRPISGPVVQTPFAVIDAVSIDVQDFIPNDLVYEDRTGQIYMVKHNPEHRWLYLSQQCPHEVMLLKCYDSDATVAARYTAHSAFELPKVDDRELPARESIEARAIAFFDA